MEKTLLIRLSSRNLFPAKLRHSTSGKYVGQLSQRDFEKFMKFMSILAVIRENMPRTIYALAKDIKKDVANVAKLVAFYEKHGVIASQKTKSRGRVIKTPQVSFDRITFEIGVESSLRARRAVLAMTRHR